MKETETQKAIEAEANNRYGSLLDIKVIGQYEAKEVVQNCINAFVAGAKWATEEIEAGRSKSLEEKEKEIDSLTISIKNHALEIEKLKSRERELEEALRRRDELLEQYVWEQEEIFIENKKAADWHNNNVPGVGQTIDYMSYPPLPKMVEEAKALLNNKCQCVNMTEYWDRKKCPLHREPEFPESIGGGEIDLG